MTIRSSLKTLFLFFATTWMALVAVPSILLAQNGDRPGHKMTEVWRGMNVPPAPVLSPKDGLATLRLPDGFRAELVAAEPLVEDPVAISWDERGRLWVVEMRGFMPNVDGVGEDKPVGQIVVLDDTDRDGRMDSKAIFLDQLVMPRALAVTSSGILIAEPPHLWLCRDENNDDRCDEKIDLAEYGDPSLDKVEHTENGLLWGLDNWIYSAKSDRRLRFIDDQIEVRPTSFRGQWGISQDDFGRLYYNTNSRWLYGDFHPPEPYFRNAADRPLRIPGVSERIAPSEEVHTIRVNPGINRGYQPDMLREDGRLAKTTSVSGLCIYRGHQFPADYRGNVFIPEPAGNVVGFFRLSGGANPEAKHEVYPDPDWSQREFLASADERFRPVDCAVGPDGALTVIDMYRGILQHRQYVTTYLRKQILERELDRPLGLGRIYRIVAEDRPTDFSRPKLSTRGEQIAALSHSNGWHRDTAQRLLVEAKDPKSIVELRKLAAGTDLELTRIHALWTLHGLQESGLDALDSGTVLLALKSKSQQVQITGLRVTSGLATAEKERVERTVLELAHRPDQTVARIALFALGDFESLAPLESLVEFSRSEREALRLAAVSGLGGHEGQALDELLRHPDCLRKGRCDKSLESLLSSLLRRGDKAGISGVLDRIDALRQKTETAALAKRLILSMTTLPKEPDFRPLPIAPPPPLVAGLAANEETRDLATDLGPLFGSGATAGSSDGFDRVAARRLFQACESCHDDGQAASGMAPPLVGASLAVGPPENLIKVILDGVTGPMKAAGSGELWNDVMPGFRNDRRFTSEALAALVSYVRSAWGNDQEPVDASTVDQIRKATAERSEPWRVDELEAQP